MSDNKFTRRVALLENQKYGSVVVWMHSGDKDPGTIAGMEEYVRISEWMPVEFKPLSSSEVTGAQLMALTKLREQTTKEFAEKLEYIDARIANLRALTGPDVQP